MGGDRKAEEVLKYLVTSPFVEIERKGVDSINLPSVLRIFISAKASWVIPASPDERRWAVFEVSDARRNDRQYWNAFHAERLDDGPAALLHYLQRYDLSGFDVSRVPETDGLRNQKLASLRGVNRWWFDILYTGEIGSNFHDWENKSLAIEREELRSLFVAYLRGRQFDGPPLDARDFGKAMREMIKSLGDTRPNREGLRVWQYVLPPLPAAQREFEAWLRSPVDWERE